MAINRPFGERFGARRFGGARAESLLSGANVAYQSRVRIDLHRHLEGSHSPRALLAVAEQHGIRHPVFFDAAANRYRTELELVKELVLAAPSDDASLFYACITRARAAYVSAAAVRDLAERAFREAALETDGFEMRVSLFSMTRTVLENEQVAWRELKPTQFAERSREMLLAVLAARDAAQLATGKSMLLRLGFSRTFESEPHYRALAGVVEEHASALSGLDILGIVNGSEKEPLPLPLVDIVTGLRRALPDLTVHAGEFEGHDSVDRTLALEPQGIGHGVHAVQSDATLAKLREDGVTLEVCPTSNRLLIPTALAELVEMHGAHPLAVLQRADVHAVLGSDDPTPMGTDFAREWALLGELQVDRARLEADTARRWGQLKK